MMMISDETKKVALMALVFVLISAVTAVIVMSAQSTEPSNSPSPSPPTTHVPVVPPTNVPPSSAPSFAKQLSEVVNSNNARPTEGVWDDISGFLASLRQIGTYATTNDVKLGKPLTGLNCIASMTVVSQQWSKCKKHFAGMLSMTAKDAATEEAERSVLDHDASFQNRPTFLLAAIRLNMHQMVLVVEKLAEMARTTDASAEIKRSLADKLFSEHYELFNNHLLELSFFIVRHRALIKYSRDTLVVWQSKPVADSRPQRLVLAMLRTVLAANDRMETGLVGMLSTNNALATSTLSCEALSTEFLDPATGTLRMFVDGGLGLMIALSARTVSPSASSEFLATLAFSQDDSELPMLHGRHREEVVAERTDTMEIAGARLRRALCDADRDIGWNLLCQVEGLEPVEQSFLAGVDPSPTTNAAYHMMTAAYSQLEDIQADINARRARFPFSAYHVRYQTVSQLLSVRQPKTIIKIHLEECRALVSAIVLYQRALCNAVCQSTEIKDEIWDRIEAAANPSNGDVSVVLFTNQSPQGKTPVSVNSSMSSIPSLFSGENITDLASQSRNYPDPDLEGLRNACVLMSTSEYKFIRILDDKSWSGFDWLGTLSYEAPESKVNTFADAIELICRLPLFVLEIEASIDYLVRLYDDYYMYVLPLANSQNRMKVASEDAERCNRALIEMIRQEIEKITKRVQYIGDIGLPAKSPIEKLD